MHRIQFLKNSFLRNVYFYMFPTWLLTILAKKNGETTRRCNNHLHLHLQLSWSQPTWVQVSCEPTSQKDADKLGEALNKLAAEVRNPVKINALGGWVGKNRWFWLGFSRSSLDLCFFTKIISWRWVKVVKERNMLNLTCFFSWILKM